LSEFFNQTLATRNALKAGEKEGSGAVLIWDKTQKAAKKGWRTTMVYLRGGNTKAK